MRGRAAVSRLVLLLILGLLTSAAAAAGVSRETRADLKAGLPEKRQDAVRAAVREAGAEAVPLLLPIAAGDKDGGVRDVAFTELSKVKGDEVVAAVVRDGLGSREAGERAVAAELIGRLRRSGAGEALASALADRDLEVRRAAAWAAGQCKASEAGPALVALVDEEDDPLLRSIAVEAVSRIRARDVAVQLARWAVDGDAGVRAASLRSLRFHDRDEAARRVAAALRAGADDQVAGVELIAALEEARALRREETIAPTIALLEHPRGRVVALGYAVLREVTAMELPVEPAAWREWWEHHGEGFRVPTEKGARAAAGSSRVRFYGAPIVSDRVTFVIDFSGSMRDPGADGAPKIDGARDALREALEAMPDTAKFNVVAFGAAPRVWKDGLIPVTKRNVKDAITFLKGAGPRGLTNVYDALEIALADPEGDAVVLLSDGAPSTGRFEYYSRIERHIGFVNRLRGASISCVALTANDSARRFLKGLADETGGTYAER